MLASIDHVVYAHLQICLNPVVYGDVVDALLRFVAAATQKDTQV